MKGRLHGFHILQDFLLGYIFEPRAVFQRKGQICVRVAYHLEIGKKKNSHCIRFILEIGVWFLKTSHFL